MAPSPRSRVLALALGGWTLLTWTTRVPLYLTDAELDAADKVRSTLPVLAFVGLAAAVVGLVLARRGAAGTAVLALAGWSIAYWVVRLPFIYANDHAVPFYVVHTVLAVVAVTLSVLAGRAVLADRAAGGVRAPGVPVGSGPRPGRG